MVWLLLTALALFFLSWSLLAVAPTPSRRFWKPALAAVEWGHWLAAFSLGVAALARLAGAPAWSVASGAAAAVLFLSPVARAVRFVRRLDPGPRSVSAVPAGFPARRPPLRLRDLLHIPLPAVEKSRHVYWRGGGTELALDLYRPATAAALPPITVVVVHGGSWNSGNSTQLSGMNRYLAGRGYAVAAVNYRLAPRFQFPAPVEDVLAAIRFLRTDRARLGLGSDRVVLLGRSSGGHLALVAAYAARDPDLRGVIALYAPTDMRWSWGRPAPKRMMDSNRVIADFLGGGPDRAPDRFDLASPTWLARAEAPPTLLIHGGRDELVSPEQSRRLADALVRAGARHWRLELPWGRHGLDANLAGPSGQIVLWALERFLAEVGGGEASSPDVRCATSDVRWEMRLGDDRM